MTESGYKDREQSEIKHYAIRLYLEAAARILGSAWDIKYVDCCAGPWNSTDSSYRDTSFGIAFEALKATRTELATRNVFPSIECLFIEKDSVPFQQLNAFTQQRNSSEIKLRAENWDFTEKMQKLFAIARLGAPSPSS